MGGGKHFFCGEGRTNENLELIIVTSGPMRGLNKNYTQGADIRQHGHGVSMTESAQWGRFSEKKKIFINF